MRENNLSLYSETGCGKLEGDELLQEKVPLCYCHIGPDQKLVEATSSKLNCSQGNQGPSAPVLILLIATQTCLVDAQCSQVMLYSAVLLKWVTVPLLTCLPSIIACSRCILAFASCFETSFCWSCLSPVLLMMSLAVAFCCSLNAASLHCLEMSLSQQEMLISTTHA